MKTAIRNLLGLSVLATLLSGCIPSLNPFYSASDLSYEARLLGEWRATKKCDGPEVWKFEASGDQSYKLTVTDKDEKQGQFRAHLFKMKGEYFLDLIPSDCNYGDMQIDLVGCAMFPGHLLVRVSRLEPELRLAFCDFDWLQKRLDIHPKALAHRVEDKQILLTASTRDLQRFVLKHLQEGELFGEAGDFERTSLAPAP